MSCFPPDNRKECRRRAALLQGLLRLLLRVEIFLDHQRHLEDDRVIELAQIESRQLFNLFQTVDEGVAMYEELSRGLGDVEVVFKELVDCVERLLIQRLDRVFLEDLAEEHFAQGRRQLVDDAADAEVFVVNDGLLGVEDLADLDRGLGLLVAVGKLAQVLRDGADADSIGEYSAS